MKYLVLAASASVNLCLGGIYAWSVFVPRLVEDYGYNTTQTQIVFGTVVFLLTVTMLFTGKLEARLGPHNMLMICALLIFLGYFTTSLSGSNFGLLWVGYGVIGGAAIGFGYVSVLAASMRWFPGRKGLAAGLVLAGYGFGAIILSIFAQTLLDRGWDVMVVFRFTGVVFSAVIFICALIISNPNDYKRNIIAVSVRRSHLILNPKFIVLALTTGLGTLPGLMIIGNLKPIALSFGFSNLTAVIAISLLSVGNTSGRILGGITHDRLKSQTIKLLLFLVSLSTLLIAATNMANSIFFLAIIFLAGISYGGMLSNIPAQVADEYGHEHFGVVYPMVILVHGITALFAAPLGGFFYDEYNTYLPAIFIASGIGLVCLAGFSIAYKQTTE